MNHHDKERSVQFIFWDNETFFEKQRIEVPMEHFEACMLVNEPSTNAHEQNSFNNSESDYFFAVMFCDHEHQMPFKLIKFYKTE